MSSVLDTVQMYVDNFSNEVPYRTIRKETFRALREDCGYRDMTPDDLDDLKRSGRIGECYASVGLAVRDKLLELIGEDVAPETFPGAVLHDLINGIDTYELGAAFAPEDVDDYREWYTEQQ